MLTAVFGARVVFEDEDLLVLDKPSGISIQSGAADDLVARGRSLLSSRGARAPYVGAPVPALREASGVVVLTKQKRANGPLAQAREAGKIETELHACAVARQGAAGRPARAPGHDEVQRRGDRVRVRVRGAGRDPLAGLRVAGDVERGGPPLFRPLVHAARVALPHPITGAPLVFTSALPDELSSWVEDGWTLAPPLSASTLRAHIEVAALRRFAIAGDGLTDALRLAHEEGDGLPGVAIDVYGEHAVLSVSSPEAARLEGEIASALVDLGLRGVYVKRRPRQASTLVDTRRDEVAPAAPIAGEPAADPTVVHESGDPFVVRLGDGLSTGIFLDQRANRAMVRARAKDARVLNLFAYCCAFTVSAAAGGAARTTSVDVSKTVLAWGEENLRSAGLADEAKHRFVCMDAVSFLARAKVRGDRYDLILLDPPSFATTKSARFSAASDYEALAASCIAVLAPGGTLLACTNHRGIAPSVFVRFLRRAAASVGREVVRLEELPAPVDYPPPPGGAPHLKSVTVTVR